MQHPAGVASSGGLGTASITWTQTTTAGNFLIVAAAGFHTMTAPTITPPSGSWSESVTITNGTFRVSLFIFPSCDAESSTGNFSVTGGSPLVAIAGCEYSGVATSTPLDKSATNTGSTGNLDSGTTASTTQNVEAVVAAFGIRNGSSFSSPTNSFTIEGQGTDGANIAVGISDKILAATGTQNTGVTPTTSTTWAGVIGTYLGAAAAAAGGGGQARLLRGVGYREDFSLSRRGRRNKRLAEEMLRGAA